VLLHFVEVQYLSVLTSVPKPVHHLNRRSLRGLSRLTHGTLPLCQYKYMKVFVLPFLLTYSSLPQQDRQWQLLLCFSLHSSTLSLTNKKCSFFRPLTDGSYQSYS